MKPNDQCFIYREYNTGENIMSMSKQDKKDIADMISASLTALITAKKPEIPTKKGKQTKIPEKEENASPTHEKKDIPQILTDMTPKDSVEIFGNLLESEPYKAKISPFYKKYNIVLDTDKYERKTLTYEQKHNIILKQLAGTSKKEFSRQKARHLKFLREKLANPPVTNIYGQTMSDKNLENWQNSLSKEVARWENESFKE